jgi:flagellar basal-body rod protein FlgC
MNLMTAMDVSATGMAAQRIRLNVISMNLANAETTRTGSGGPYQRRTVIFRSTPVEGTFENVFERHLQEKIQGVTVTRIEAKGGDDKRIYDPSHPDADAAGYVHYPNVNLVEEMVSMLEASRSYEANVTAAKAAKNMALKALEIGR